MACHNGHIPPSQITHWDNLLVGVNGMGRDRDCKFLTAGSNLMNVGRLIDNYQRSETAKIR